ncbi:glycosyltransferase [Brevibacterium sandarakinum]|uniref:glycosyltransferase n=1 Tax=Brevibacterium sandarakinum TaxID=629680 RepID=UPI0012FDD67E|nr:glycosyltransferase [Brevibacterium sandarakinum]
MKGFPDGRYFANLGELAKNYGGTSSVVFHRSKTFVEQTGHPVDILTFGHLRDYDSLTEEMLADGRFVPGMRFRNMWAELSVMHPAEAGTVRRECPDFSPLDDSTASEVVRGRGVPLRKFRKRGSTVNLQIDMCRADGSVIVSDRRDLTTSTGKSRHSLILCDTKSRPVKEFGSIVELRNYWLDSVVGDDLAFLFSDTFGIAGFTHQYKRNNVVLVQTFHNNHLRHGTKGQIGYTQDRYLPFLDNIDDFDATVVLTTRQKHDLDALMGPSPQRWVVPNSRTVGGSDGGSRDRTRGMCVGRLVAGKQIDHAIHAVVAANERLEAPIHLDIYGEGTARSAIEQTIADIGTTDISLIGHDPTAADRFASASFSLLTSRSEAMPLVLAESMSRGCIPIAYDIAYGPGEIITDGIDGFLVEPDDVAALTDTIVKLQTMDDADLESLRRAARKRAHDFSDAAVAEKWGEVLRETLAHRREPEELAVSECETSLEASDHSLVFSASFNTSRLVHALRAHLVLRSRSEPVLTRLECAIDSVEADRYTVSTVIGEDRISWVNRGIIDAHLEVHDESGRAARRLPAPLRFRDGEKISYSDFTVYATKHGSLSFKHK